MAGAVIKSKKQPMAARTPVTADKRLTTTLGREKNFNDEFAFVQGAITGFC